MISDPQGAIQEISKRLVIAAQPIKVILFGSFARGTPGPDSDIDILVIKKKVESKHAEMVRLRKVLKGIPFPIDVLVISEEEFKERSVYPSNVYYWANQDGKVLYEAA